MRKDCRGAERAEMAQPDTATTAIHYSLVLRQDLYRLSPLSPSSPSSSFVPANNNVSTPFPPFLFHFAEGAAFRSPPHLHRNHAERNAILRCWCVPFHRIGYRDSLLSTSTFSMHSCNSRDVGCCCLIRNFLRNRYVYRDIKWYVEKKRGRGIFHWCKLKRGNLKKL